ETRRKLSAQYFAEDLGDGVALEMMKVPGGTFMMGSPSDEADYSDSEGPRHSVAVPEFFMGRFEITREQWRQIAKMPQVSIYLEEDPSSIKDSLKQPVEQVKWVEAVEVCERLKKKTGYAYRLPSEAEWEYAERAGTTTPFAFGPMITPAIVNYYNDESLHGSASKDPKKADVGSLGTANAFGLYDMPGNVWEWCLDVWHENYEGAPTDGSAWLSGGDSTLHVIRGGSWLDLGRYCRSAFRDADSAGERNSRNGFRVVCGARNK
ncbi:MAG: formylglycine-generating enzyme family protein, partial [Blastocatellia bacterium]|nr:formylglycine-generating enzyme family protein [Blastocatellia bacterium]